jgi:hypothetical protein
MGLSTRFPTPERTPNRPEIADASTPWSNILLEELRARTQPDANPPRRHGFAKFGGCGSRRRNQSRIFWLTILVILGLSWVKRGGRKAVFDGGGWAAQPQLAGLQFLDSNHPSIRVRQAHAFEIKAAANGLVVRWPLGNKCRWNT